MKAAAPRAKPETIAGWLGLFGNGATAAARDDAIIVASAAEGLSLRLMISCDSERLSFAAQAQSGAIFEGCLYNREALLDALATPANSSNASLVLAAYLVWGEDALHRLKGIFVFCIWDGRSGTLFCARDPAGVYPFFYAHSGRSWLFSTSVDTLLEQPEVDNTVNRGALATYLWGKWKYCDIEETYFSNIYRVPPGHAFKARGVDTNAKVYRYWDPIPAGAICWTRESEIEQFPSLIKESIGRCLQLGKAGIYLSGGLDSGTLATYATEYAHEKNLLLPHALSLVYPESDVNEERVQKGIASRLGIPQTLICHEQVDDADRLLPILLKVNDSWPHPLAVGLSPLHLILGERAREEGCDLVLSGEGADEWLEMHSELAADFMRRLEILNLLRLSKSIRAASRDTWYGTAKRLLWYSGLRHLLNNTVASCQTWASPEATRKRRQRSLEQAIPAWLAPDPELRKELFERAEKSAQNVQGSIYRRAIYSQILNHPLTALYKEDNFESSRRTGVFMLEPFYDPDVIQFLVRTPPWLRGLGGRYKGLLRQILHQRFPELGYDRQRKPYATNFNAVRVLRGAKHFWPTLKGTRTLADLGVVDLSMTESVIREILEQEQLGNTRYLWMTLCAEVWARTRVRSPANHS